jgi:hypothetical protein
MRSLQELYADNLPTPNRTRSADLAPVKQGGMYLTTHDSFMFLRAGRPVYSMPHNEAEVLYIIAVRENKLVLAIKTLRSFRPNLSLSDAKDMVEYIKANFSNPE